jgi:thiosulfate reductase / polysulfide reductase chain A
MAHEQTRQESSPEPMTRHRSICCHCPTRCGVLVDVAGGRPVAVKGDPHNPTSKGFVCVRGQAAIEYYEHPDRLTHVLKRAGERGEDRWHRIPWNEAIAEVKERIEQSTSSHGKESLAYFSGTYHGTDYSAGVRFMNLFGSPNYTSQAAICAGPRTEAEFLTFGISPAAANIKPGVTRQILLWGQRASASNVPAYARYLEAQRAGAELVVIDPVQTQDAKAANLWLPIRPGTDAALVMGLLNVIISEGLYDRKFVSETTIGFAELQRRVERFPLARVAALTGIETSTIVQVARGFAAGPSIFSAGMPNGMGRNALNFERARCCLIALSGNLGRPGGHRLGGPPQRIQTKIDLELYDALPHVQRRKAVGADEFRLLSVGYERMNAAARRNWPSHRYLIASSRGAGAHAPSLFRAIRDGRPYQVRSVIVQHANIVGSHSNVRLVREALGSPNLDLLVVQELFKTATSAFADYVFPAASWLEKPWMYVGGDSSVVLATPRPVRPQYDRKTDYELFRDLGRAFGQDEFWPDELEDVFDRMLAPAGLTFAELAGREKNWIDDCAQDDAQLPARYGTPTGRIELTSSTLSEIGCDPLPNFEEPPGNPNEAYPLRLLTAGTDITHTHQDHHQIASLRKLHPAPLVRMRPETAEASGLADGDWTDVESPLGRVRQRVKLSLTVPADAVEAERWWFPERSGALPSLYGVLESNVNVLVDDEPGLCDRAYGSWPLRDQRCRLRKVDATV